MILNRIELKYYLPLSRYRDFRSAMHPFVVADENITPGSNSYSVHSVYYDSPGFKYYLERINGEAIRTKFRIRYYKEFGMNSSQEEWQQAPIWLELKSKHFNSIQKIRYKTEYKNLENILEFSTQTEKLDKNLAALLYEYNLYHLKPVVKISYRREALRGIYEKDTRITFDSEIRAYPVQYFSLLKKESPTNTLSPFYCVVEIKLTDSAPTWLTRIIERFNLQQVVHSKYTTAIDKCGILRTALGEFYEG